MHFQALLAVSYDLQTKILTQGSNWATNTTLSTQAAILLVTWLQPFYLNA